MEVNVTSENKRIVGIGDVIRAIRGEDKSVAREDAVKVLKDIHEASHRWRSLYRMLRDSITTYATRLDDEGKPKVARHLRYLIEQAETERGDTGRRNKSCK